MSIIIENLEAEIIELTVAEERYEASVARCTSRVNRSKRRRRERLLDLGIIKSRKIGIQNAIDRINGAAAFIALSADDIDNLPDTVVNHRDLTGL